MDILQDRARWIEHRIRERLAAHPGMRPGKAIRQILPDLSDDQRAALGRLWDGEQFAVDVSADEDSFVRAYDAVRSCMHGQGALCWRAYHPHGIAVAIAYRNGEIVARALVRIGTRQFNKTYGEESFALGVYLSALCGLERTPAWLDGIAEIGVFEDRVEREEVLVPEQIFGYTIYSVPQGYQHRYHVLRIGGELLYCAARRVERKVKRRVCVFQPYLDTH